MGLVVNAMPWPLYPWERGLVQIVQEAGWAPGLVWTGAENLTPTTGIQSQDYQVCSELLYLLHLRDCVSGMDAKNSCSLVPCSSWGRFLIF